MAWSAFHQLIYCTYFCGSRLTKMQCSLESQYSNAEAMPLKKKTRKEKKGKNERTVLRTNV